MPGVEFSSLLVCIRFQDYILSTRGLPADRIGFTVKHTALELGCVSGGTQLRGSGTEAFITSTPRSWWYSGPGVGFDKNQSLSFSLLLSL